MKIIILNGSPRKKGLTAGILRIIEQRLTERGADVKYYDLADIDMKPCAGCCSCYRTGRCIYKDDAERISAEIADCSGIVIGSPTYASNVSGITKTFIDRGHFVIEQLLYGKYAISVATGENYGSRTTSRVLNDLMLYSGALTSSKIVINAPFGADVPKPGSIIRKADRFYDDIDKKRHYPLQSMIHRIIFSAGIAPFVRKKGKDYKGVTDRWNKLGLK